MPEFSSHLFWDCDPQSIDFEAHARFVIGLVLSRGTWADWKELKRRYPRERLRNEVVKLRNLDAKTRTFCFVVLDITPGSFR